MLFLGACQKKDFSISSSRNAKPRAQPPLQRQWKFFLCVLQLLQMGVLPNCSKGECPFDVANCQSEHFSMLSWELLCKNVFQFCLLQTDQKDQGQKMGWKIESFIVATHHHVFKANLNCFHSLNKKISKFWFFTTHLLTLSFTRAAMVMLCLTISQLHQSVSQKQ